MSILAEMSIPGKPEKGPGIQIIHRKWQNRSFLQLFLFVIWKFTNTFYNNFHIQVL